MKLSKSGINIQKRVYTDILERGTDLHNEERGSITYKRIDVDEMYRVELPVNGDKAIVDVLTIEQVDESESCPFCGTKHGLTAVFEETLEDEGYKLEVAVHCFSCGSQGPTLYGIRIPGDNRPEEFVNAVLQGAVIVWNNRNNLFEENEIEDEDMSKIEEILANVKAFPSDIEKIITDIRAKMTQKKSPVDEIKEKINVGADIIKEVTNEKIDSIKESLGDKLQNLANKLKK